MSLMLAFLGVAACGADLQQPPSPPPQADAAPRRADAQPQPPVPDLEPYHGTEDAAPPLPPDAGAAPDTAPPSPCHYDEKLFDGHCYSAPGMKWLTYQTAEQICAARGAQVASIASSAANDVVFALLQMLNQQAWIGLRRVNGAFAWHDGTPVGFLNWAPGEPNNEGGNEDCAVMWGPGLRSFPELKSTWNDTACDTDVDTVICRRKP
jgi:hypothetical protein